MVTRYPSPRACGLRRRRNRCCPGPRSIPTCVGPAPSPSLRDGSSPVHPHVRGACTHRCAEAGSRLGPSPRAWGLPALALPVLDEGGPSPRAWGLRRGTAVRALDMRSIPTCVGPALNDLQRRAALSFLNQESPDCALTCTCSVTKSDTTPVYRSAHTAPTSGSTNS